mgnify:CR=1 FL=1
MSRNDFILALTLFAKEIPLRSLIMAAMLVAKEPALTTLKSTFPEIWKELEMRSRPGGINEP